MNKRSLYQILFLSLASLVNHSLAYASDFGEGDKPFFESMYPSIEDDIHPFGLEMIYLEGNVKKDEGDICPTCSSFDEDENMVTAIFPPGKIGPEESGFNFASKLGPNESKTISYKVKFSPSFDFVKGGKLPGLCGGQGASGGNRANGNNGFSARVVWRENGRMVMYVYHVNQADQYGDQFEWKDAQGKTLYFQKDQWQNVKVFVQMNDQGQSNGIVRTYLNDKLAFEKTDFTFRTTGSFSVDRLCFETFFGGGDPDWAPKKYEKLYIKDLIIQ